jgi:hypothetical protein
MTKITALSAAVLLSAALATPVFAQDVNVAAPHHSRVHHRHHVQDYRGTYNQVNGPLSAAPQSRFESNREDMERDPSRVGGEDTFFNPPS